MRYSAEIFGETEFNCFERSLIIKGITTFSVNNILFLGFLFFRSITEKRKAVTL